MSTSPKIRIKLIARGRAGNAWRKQLPPSGSFTGECEFVFEPDAQQYDWLVVVDDISRKLGAPTENLKCADSHTLLVTTEPPTITCFGQAFCSQFHQVLTSQSEEALPHPRRIYSHTGNFWFNGHRFSEFDEQALPSKSKTLSTVCSSKQQKYTIHNDRYQFSQWLRREIPEMDMYGHGSNYVEQKYDALDPYKFHLAIENYRGLHHWTEKLADPYLSGCFPIYYGCANVGDYFPQDSYLEIDINDRKSSLDSIRGIISDHSFHASRTEALLEARRRVLYDYNMMHIVEKMVVEQFDPSLKPSGRPLFNRKQMRLRRPGDALRLAKWHLKRHLP
ncbi:MAG: glycosyltransferase family 10 domain-containing protein [Luteolibacter sp.]